MAPSDDLRVIISRATDRYGFRERDSYRSEPDCYRWANLLRQLMRLIVVVGKLIGNSRAQIVIGAKGFVCSRRGLQVDPQVSMTVGQRLS